MNNQNMAVDTIQEIYRWWQIDAHRTQWVGKKPSPTEPYGFDCWPGDFKVEVRVIGPRPMGTQPVYRMSVRCDYLTAVDVTPAFLSFLPMFNRLAPTFSLVFDPRLLTVSLESTAYLYEGFPLYPMFIAGQTILQPIEAQARSVFHAETLGGEPDRSSHPNANGNMGLDKMFGVENVFAAHGKAPNRWVGTGEFEEIIRKWGRSDRAFGTADETGLTIEIPFGEDTALLRISTDQPHPRLGNGLLVVLKIPKYAEEDATNSETNWLNFFEARTWGSSRIPFIGNWTTDVGRAGESDLMCPAFCSFTPNFTYMAGLAENLVLWNLTRAHWVRELFYPDLVDLSMDEILSRRLM